LTLDYAAPEQLNGGSISTATDVHALGVLLYELLTGQRPFTGTPRAIEEAILDSEPRIPKTVPVDLGTIVLKSLKKAPVERYATVNAMGKDLEHWLRGEPVLAQSDSTWYRLRRFVGRHRIAVATGAGVLTTVIGASVVSVWQAQTAREQSRIAGTEARTAQEVQNFLGDIFRANSGDQTDPMASRNKTAKALLDEGAARIDASLQDAPLAKLQLLKIMGDMYEQMDHQGRHLALVRTSRRTRGAVAREGLGRSRASRPGRGACPPERRSQAVQVAGGATAG
jgi:serine/threonine-protein kinase